MSDELMEQAKYHIERLAKRTDEEMARLKPPEERVGLKAFALGVITAEWHAANDNKAQYIFRVIMVSVFGWAGLGILATIASSIESLGFTINIKDLFIFFLSGSALLITTSWIVYFFTASKNLRRAENDFRTYASVLNEPFQNKIEELNRLSSNSESLLARMRANLQDCMISWEDSAQAERRALEVNTLTPDLAWLFYTNKTNSKKKYVEIVEDVLATDNQYKYLVFRLQDPQGAGQSSIWNEEGLSKGIKELSEYISSLQPEEIAKVARGLQVKLIMNEGDIGTVKLDWKDKELTQNLAGYQKLDKLLALPLPGDIVVYKETELAFSGPEDTEFDIKDLLVMSKGSVSENQLVGNKFDYLFIEPSQIASFTAWWDSLWYST